MIKALVFLGAIGSAVGQGGSADVVDPCDEYDGMPSACNGAAACFWFDGAWWEEGFCAAKCDSRPEVFCESSECVMVGNECKNSCHSRFATQEACDTEGTDCMWYVHHSVFQWCEAACSATPAGADCRDHFCERGESGACEKSCRVKYPNFGLNDGSACDADPKCTWHADDDGGRCRTNCGFITGDAACRDSEDCVWTGAACAAPCRSDTSATCDTNNCKWVEYHHDESEEEDG